MTKQVLDSVFGLLCVGLLTAAASVNLYASSAVELAPEWQKRKAAEELALYSQSIVKGYFYMGKGLNSIMAKDQIERHTEKMGDHVDYLSEVIVDVELRDLLRFLAFKQEELSRTLDQPYSEDNAALALQMSDVILAGAESIIRHLRGDQHRHQNMLHVLEHQRYLVERMTKLYIASIAGFQNLDIVNQLQDAVKQYDDGLNKIEAYRYPYYQRDDVVKLRQRWELAKRFYTDVREGELPRKVFYSAAVMERILNKLVRYQYNLERDAREQESVANL